MRFERAVLSPLTGSFLIVAVALLALPTGALAGSDGPQPALEIPQAGAQVAEDLTVAESPQPALATPEAGEQVPVLAGEGSVTPSLLPNPCYQFDDPQHGCYYTWRPSDFCCISPAPWCPAICY